MRSNATCQPQRWVLLVCMISISVAIASNANDPVATGIDSVDLTLVSAQAEATAETADRLVVNAQSEGGDTQALTAFGQVGNEAVTVLGTIENESRAGTSLAGTRDEFDRLVQLVDVGRHIVNEEGIHLDSVDQVQLVEQIAVLDRQYSAPPAAPLVEGADASPSGSPVLETAPTPLAP
jgi:hypothetical protein